MRSPTYACLPKLEQTDCGAGQILEKHTMHLHGHRFWVIGHGALPFDEPAAYAKVNLVDPPLKDTLPLRTGTYAILRFEATSPGIWHFHCHLLVHMMMGLQMAFNIGEDQQPKPPLEWYDAQNFDGHMCPGADDS